MTLTPIHGKFVPMESIWDRAKANNDTTVEKTLDSANPTFLDVFSDVVNNAVTANAQKSQDMLDLMLGNTDDVEGIQLNLAKAEVATELLVTVKNTVFDAYNEIIKMQI